MRFLHVFSKSANVSYVQTLTCLIIVIVHLIVIKQTLFSFAPIIICFFKASDTRRNGNNQNDIVWVPCLRFSYFGSVTQFIFLFNEAQTRINMLIDSVDAYINIVHYSEYALSVNMKCACFVETCFHHLYRLCVVFAGSIHIISMYTYDVLAKM